MADSKRPRINRQEAIEASVTNMPVVEEHKEEEPVILFEALHNILCDFTVKEFCHAKTPLLVTPTMSTFFSELEDAIHEMRTYETLLQGPTGVGKTTSLIYIGHMARKKGYIVFPLQARDFVNQARPMSFMIRQFLLNWINAVGRELLVSIPACVYPNYSNLFEIANQSSDEKVIVMAFSQLVHELKRCTTKPVVFLIDQCNSFNVSKQMIKLFSDDDFEEDVGPWKNPVGAMFLDYKTFKVKWGGIFYGYASAFQLMPTAHDGNATIFSTCRPMNCEDFRAFVEFLVKHNQLPYECICDELFELCGGIPREAREFGSEMKRLFSVDKSTYKQWKEAYIRARTPFYKTRVKGLLDKEKLGTELFNESVTFAASLFVGKKMMSAPDIWIDSGLIVTKGEYQELVCPAAELAILSVFNEKKVIRQAIENFRSDVPFRYRSLELALVYIFRRSRGLPIEFYYTNLCGTNQKSLIITAGLIEYGTNRPAANSIPRNTLFVCSQNTSVVDVFIHDANGSLILIQVSDSCYRDHKAKYNPEDHYIKLYTASARNPLNTKLQYIYLTTNTSLMATTPKKSKAYRKDVLLVAGDNMKRLFGDLFDKK